MKDLLFLDVETPNVHNDRISSIGLVRCNSDGVVNFEKAFLINPEEPFSDINMRITGLSPSDVEDAPIFPELWQQTLRDLFEDAYLIAHNAPFDLSVLWKLFDAYSLGTPDWQFACTKLLSQQWHPEFPNYKLPTVCRCLNLSMGDHHRALSDADACRRIFQRLVSEDETHIPVYELYRPGGRGGRCISRSSSERKLSEKTSNYRDFLDLCELVVANDKVSVEEAIASLSFIECHDKLREDPAVGEISALMMAALADGDIDENESSKLVELLKGLINPCEASSAKEEIQIEGKSFCLSGNFNHGSKESIKKYLKERGGVILSCVSKKCNYVLVGGQGSEMWTTKNYGSKVKKALDLRAGGFDIEIIGEDSLRL